MPRKRVRGKARQDLHQSNPSQFWDLYLSEHGRIGGPRPVFATVEERRETWERHREEMMRHYPPNDFEHHPGRRPGGWWSYDAPEGLLRPRGGSYSTDLEEWEALAQAGVLFPEEAAVLRRHWLGREMEGTRARLKGTLDAEKQGREPSGLTWDDLLEKFGRQAMLLGAETEWTNTLEEVRNAWHRDGCSMCSALVQRGHCARRECQHYPEGGGDGADTA